MTGEGNISTTKGLMKYTSSDGVDMAMAWGTHTTVAASDDNIATGLSSVVHMQGSFKAAPDADPGLVNVLAGTNAGTIKIETWLAAGTGVATAFGVTINWFAIGRV